MWPHAGRVSGPWPGVAMWVASPQDTSAGRGGRSVWLAAGVKVTGQQDPEGSARDAEAWSCAHPASGSNGEPPRPCVRQAGPVEALQGAMCSLRRVWWGCTVWTWADRCPHRIPCDVCDNLFVSSFLKKENDADLHARVLRSGLSRGTTVMWLLSAFRWKCCSWLGSVSAWTSTGATGTAPWSAPRAAVFARPHPSAPRGSASQCRAGVHASVPTVRRVLRTSPFPLTGAPPVRPRVPARRPHATRRAHPPQLPKRGCRVTGQGQCGGPAPHTLSNPSHGWSDGASLARVSLDLDSAPVPSRRDWRGGVQQGRVPAPQHRRPRNEGHPNTGLDSSGDALVPVSDAFGDPQLPSRAGEGAACGRPVLDPTPHLGCRARGRAQTSGTRAHLSSPKLSVNRRVKKCE